MAQIPENLLLPLFLVGLLGGGHCVGMCGGIVGALALGGRVRWQLHLAYNVGRILSYTLAGALAGALGAAGLLLGQPMRLFLHLLASLLLLAMGFYLLGMTRGLAWLEAWGGRLWRRLQPQTRRFLPVRGVRQALPLGILWGWLPCGLVYSALATAMTAGGAAAGALCLLAFGLGTLPNLLLAGLLLARFRGWLEKPWLRRLAAMVIIAFAGHGLLGVWRLSELWMG